ncbi:CHAT domain-containing tetratricopeptide repeat protein [Limimaricola cinnabarinus]|uniref:CHAT domain-containing protein n=1 Tax=Limimaricola cinnabarinus LL-001 TaxID=1337093 RepID=U2YP26_9RHOB|nr:CHAT domain-containing protein [Limimaricola cinnabarinus]GAD57121.1 hypothetical protein MBELCI_3173 [Limimaricola cinnabarinus LL-001]
MDWQDWLPLSPEAFESRLRQHLDRTSEFDDAVDLYNELITNCGHNPRHVGNVARAIAALMHRRDMQWERLLFLELTARAKYTAGDVHGAFEALDMLARADDTDDTREVVLEILNAAVEDTGSVASSIDHHPVVLRAAAGLLEHFALWDELGDLKLRSALLYSRHGASQAAYRTIVDVESKAYEVGSRPLLARALQAAVVVSLEEGDADFAVKMGREALAILAELDARLPVELLANLGTAFMRNGDTVNGENYLRRAMNEAEAGSDIGPVLMANLAACLREAGNFVDAQSMIAKARHAHDGNSDPEAILELELVAARICAESGDACAVGPALAAAARALDEVLRDVLRFHHRRGLRERYLPRFDKLMAAMPDEGPACEALEALVACRGNALGDWLALLEWSRKTATLVQTDEVVALEQALECLRGEGVPHLFGFLEKYDDVWDWRNPVGDQWDRLSQIIASLDGRSGPALGQAGQVAMIDAARKRLAEGDCIMAITHAGDPLLWSFYGDRYRRTALPADTRSDWAVAQLRFSCGETGRQEFANALDSWLDTVSPLLGPVLDDLAAGGVRSIRYLQDFSPSPPMTALAMRHPRLLERMRQGMFEVRHIAALVLSVEPRQISGGVAAVVDRDGDLVLPRHEAIAFADAANLPPPVVIDTGATEELPELLGDAEVLMVSTHGTPLINYTDPYFASIGGEAPHPVSIRQLQAYGDSLGLRLVLLNACYSGAGSARNFQQRFRTADAVSFPAWSLLSGCAIACASAWRTSDTAQYLFSRFSGEGLGDGLSPSSAVTSAMARLHLVTRDEAIAALSIIADSADREAATKRLANAPQHGAFSHPYLGGAMAIHSLL